MQNPKVDSLHLSSNSEVLDMLSKVSELSSEMEKTNTAQQFVLLWGHT